MYKMPPTVPISNLRSDQDQILQVMDEQPVMLTQRGKARAALVSIDQWNHVMDLLEMYRSHWRAESDSVEQTTPSQDWLEADIVLEQWAEKHGISERVPLPVE